VGNTHPGDDGADDLVPLHAESGDRAGSLLRNQVVATSARLDDEVLATQLAEVIGGLRMV
jgi:hypothetical protein